MSPDWNKDALRKAQEELAQLEKRRDALLRTIENLIELADEDDYGLTPPPGYIPQGLTDEIRTILRLTTSPLTTVQIRNSLIARNVECTSPKNLLISVHTVLDRIKDELEITERDGKPTYIVKRAYTASDMPRLRRIAQDFLATALTRSTAKLDVAAALQKSGEPKKK